MPRQALPPSRRRMRPAHAPTATTCSARPAAGAPPPSARRLDRRVGRGGELGHDRLVDLATGGLDLADHPHHPLVVARDHRGELGQRLRPVVQQPAGHRRAGLGVVALDQRRAAVSACSPATSARSTSSGLTSGRSSRQHEGEPARHAGREVAPGRAEHDHHAAGHVLAAVVADALDDRGRAGVADREPLADPAAQVQLAAGRSIEDGVAGDDLLLGGAAVRPARPRPGRTAPTRPGGPPARRRTVPCRRSRWRRRTAAA